MNFFVHKDLGNHLLQLRPKVVETSCISSFLRVCSSVLFVAIDKTTEQYIPEGGEVAKVAQTPEFKMAAYLH
jgi:hypothetical protein